MSRLALSLEGLRIFERGWLSSNNVLLRGSGGDTTLIDSGHSVHAAQTVALVQNALREAGPEQRLTRVLKSKCQAWHFDLNDKESVMRSTGS